MTRLAAQQSNPAAWLLPSLLVALMMLGNSPVLAHARLTRSNPKDKAELKEAPAQVEIWFNELLDEGFNYIEVYPAAEVNQKKRTNFVKGEPAVDKADRTHLVARLKELPPGQYVVEYRVLSLDGHTAPGRVKFTVKTAE